MTIRPILRFPDARLRLPCEDVTTFGEETRTLITDLLDTMRAAPGIGITGPHIGVLKRLTVIELPDENIVRVYVNPCIIWSSQESAGYPEGSVSMPGVTETVERPARVRVQFLDANGCEKTEDADGLLAVCLQHEIDQLGGIFWVQRLSRLKRERVVRKFEKLSQGT